MSSDWENGFPEGLTEEDPYADVDYDRTERIDFELDCVRTGMYSEIGNRESQQDAAWVSESYDYIESRMLMAVVCDGMGGLEGGERASRLCVEKMHEVYSKVDDIKKDVPRFLAMMTDTLDQLVAKLENAEGKPLGAGTTLVSIIIDDGDLYWASIGDSRIYIFTESGEMLLTRDHNYYMILSEQKKRGLIGDEIIETHPKREALVSYLGMNGIRYSDIPEKPIHLRDGDHILLCSDGLYRALSTAEMSRIILAEGDDMETAARKLVLAAVDKRRRHQDNTTAVVVKYIS